MKLNIFLYILTTIISAYSGNAQTIKHHVELKLPTIEQEATSIWRTINDIAFLEGQGYRIHLPNHDAIDSLIIKSRNRDFGNEDFPTIYTILENDIYQPNDYQEALKKATGQQEALDKMVRKLKEVSELWEWEFKSFDTYPVHFTLYGTGGSYDPDVGNVTLFTNINGEFMRYALPTNTIMHEIVHMGIEQSIVQKFNLSHGLKERIVDRVTSILFREELMGYKIQNMGDPEIDSLITEESDLKYLNTIIAKYLEEKRR